MSKLDPKNRMEAYAHQLSDDVNLLMKLALIDDERGYEQCLERIQSMISEYRSPIMKKQVKRAIEKRQKREKLWKGDYPNLHNRA